MVNSKAQPPFPSTNFPPVPLSRLIEGRHGLRVIGDTHSHAAELARAVDGARASGLAVLLLGDINDRGPDVVGAMRIALDLLRQGDGEIIPGNHDWKLARWTRGRQVDATSAGFQETLEQIAVDPAGRDIADVYAAAIAHRPLWTVLGGHVFVHAAFDPKMIELNPAPLLKDVNKVPGKLGPLAIYGEADGSVDAAGRPTRTYRWTDKVPEGVVVHVGHDPLSLTTPVFRRGAMGGLIRHMDTGIDRGGALSWVDLPSEAFLHASEVEAILTPVD